MFCVWVWVVVVGVWELLILKRFCFVEVFLNGLNEFRFDLLLFVFKGGNVFVLLLFWFGLVLKRLNLLEGFEFGFLELNGLNRFEDVGFFLLFFEDRLGDLVFVVWKGLNVVEFVLVIVNEVIFFLLELELRFFIWLKKLLFLCSLGLRILLVFLFRFIFRWGFFFVLLIRFIFWLFLFFVGDKFNRLIFMLFTIEMWDVGFEEIFWFCWLLFKFSKFIW